MFRVPLFIPTISLIALRYIALMRGNNKVDDKCKKQLSDLNFENNFGFKLITKLN